MTKEEAKHLSDILKSAADGKLIQYKANNEVSWKDLPLDTWKQISIDHYEFRIKPEPKYRPYKNAEELLKDQKEHGPYIIGNCLFIPLKIYEDAIVYYGQKDEKGFEQMFTFVDLADRFAWQDGHPCGIMEE